MKLLHSTLRPGRVLEVLENGNIKVEAPGLFSREDSENLPPVTPFLQGHSGEFSVVKVDDEVWVLSQTDNYLDLKYLRKDDLSDIDSELINEPECEIIVNRETSEGFAMLYFTQESGWVISNNGSKIQIKKSGDITISQGDPHRTIDINSGNISIGSEGSSEHSACFGDETEKSLNIIYSALEAIRQAASTNIYTQPIASALVSVNPRLQSQIPEVSSAVVTLD